MQLFIHCSVPCESGVGVTYTENEPKLSQNFEKKISEFLSIYASMAVSFYKLAAVSLVAS